MNRYLIVLTANVVDGMEEMPLANQFNDFLPKSIDLNELRHELYQWFPDSVIEKVEI
jgi:CheY-like chemotaxis protein